MFALQLEELLFATCMNSQVETHKRLQVDVITKKTLKLQAPKVMAKFFFAFMLMLHFFACSYWGIVWTCVVVVVVVVVVVAKRCSLTARPVSL